jgi:hypothetical protein
MPNWVTEIETWINAKQNFKDAIEAAANSPDYGNDRKLRQALIDRLVEFYDAKVRGVADFEDRAWAGSDVRKGFFANEVLARVVTREWRTAVRVARASPIFGPDAVATLRGRLRASFGPAVKEAVEKMERACPAPQPRCRTFRMADFAAMGADIVLTWDDDGTTGTDSQGQICRNGRDGVATEDAEMRWLARYGDDLATSVTTSHHDNLRIEVHVKARPCGHCGPELNAWLTRKALAVPIYAFTYADDQNGNGTNVYRLRPGLADGSRYLGKWQFE